MAKKHDEKVTHTQILTVIEDVRKTLGTVAEQVADTAVRVTEHSEMLKEIRGDVKDLKGASIDHNRRIETLEKAV